MDELIDILDKHGKATGESRLKSIAHKEGLYHPTVHIWCYSTTGRILLQQRGKHKETFPLKWDVSVAGHVGAGESMVSGALREMKEEIGVEIGLEHLEKIGVFKSEKQHAVDFIDREFHHIFLCLLDETVALQKQDSEVEALQWISLSLFKKWVTENYKDLVPNTGERYQMIISEIELRI